MNFHRTIHRSRRGTTLIEALIAVGVMLPVVLAIQGLASSSARVFAGGTAAADSQKQAETAVQRIARDARAARRVSTTSNLSASSPTLVLQLPAYDAGGTLSVPMSDGNTVTYAIANEGTRLTRTVSGTTTTILHLSANQQMRLTYGYAGTDTNADGSITADEYYSLSPSVVITTTVGGASAFNSTFTATQEVLLHNH